MTPDPPDHYDEKQRAAWNASYAVACEILERRKDEFDKMTDDEYESEFLRYQEMIRTAFRLHRSRN